METNMTLILHLEDDGPLREVMKIAMTTADPTIEFAQFVNSDSALKFIEENKDRISLFLLDIRVPGSTDGMGVAEKIRELGVDRPIVITSAYRKPAKDHLDKLGCQWMQKPWHILDAHSLLLPMAKRYTPPHTADDQAENRAPKEPDTSTAHPLENGNVAQES